MDCKKCFTSIEDCINSRRCFMTGEYCSKQTNIQRERQKLHSNGCINAFVIMNFSNMSDVVYKWRLKSFIESLTKYLYIDKTENRLYCLSSVKLSEEDQSELGSNQWKRVKEIEVIRADSNPASNYVICNRVCQQMQIADLIIVDVSVENTNVFYEFGMAVALGKLILPICYSESFFEIIPPEEWDGQKYKEAEHHIGLYPWRKNLFEYYGIRYRTDESETKYEEFNKAANEQYGFGDKQYNRFPYNEVMLDQKERIGEQIYKRLQETYNDAKYEHNTLVVYTMDGFLNEGQAGLCIINYYESIIQQMQKEHCFCGDRVGANFARTV